MIPELYTYYEKKDLDKIVLHKGDKIIIEIKRNLTDQRPIPNGDITPMIQLKNPYKIGKHLFQINKVEHKTHTLFLDRRFIIYGEMLNDAIPLVALIVGLAALGAIFTGILIGQIVKVGVSPSVTGISLLFVLPVGILIFYLLTKFNFYGR